MIALGGNSCALMTDMTQEQYAVMMLAGGRSPHGWAQQEGAVLMARITAGVTTSHVPATGAARDNGKSRDAYCRPLFVGHEFSKRWIAERNPTSCYSTRKKFPTRRNHEQDMANDDK